MKCVQHVNMCKCVFYMQLIEQEAFEQRGHHVSLKLKGTTTFIFFIFFGTHWGNRGQQSEVCCDISSSDYISALCKAAAARSEMMLPKLTRIDGMTLQLVHQREIAPWLHCENSHVLYLCCILITNITSVEQHWTLAQEIRGVLGKKSVQKKEEKKSFLYAIYCTVKYIISFLTYSQTTSSYNHLKTHTLWGLCSIIHQQTGPEFAYFIHLLDAVINIQIQIPFCEKK